MLLITISVVFMWISMSVTTGTDVASFRRFMIVPARSLDMAMSIPVLVHILLRPDEPARPA